MIVETRFRDVPWEEVRDGFSENEMDRAHHDWEGLRGRPVRIVAQPIPEDEGFQVGCGGPYYAVAGPDAPWPNRVCPHIAEIGD